MLTWQAVQICLSDIKVQHQPMEAKGNTDDVSIVELYLNKASSAFNLHFVNGRYTIFPNCILSKWVSFVTLLLSLSVYFWFLCSLCIN